MYTTPLSVEYIRRVLQRVADEPNVRGIVFLFKGATVSLAQAQSLAALFRRFHEWDHARNSGGVNARAKRIIVYLEEMTGASYAAAAAADYIVAPPLTEFDEILRVVENGKNFLAAEILKPQEMRLSPDRRPRFRDGQLHRHILKLPNATVGGQGDQQCARRNTATSIPDPP